MTPTEELRALYEQWRALTEEEGAALENRDWTRLTQSQTGKARLQPRIANVSRQLEPAIHEREFRSMVEHLIELERRNQALLQNLQRHAQDEQQELDRSRRHLRQLHQSYVPPARAHWQSYS